jgi:CRP-like cAMP-binding protein
MGALTPSDRGALLASGTRVQFRDNDILVLQGDTDDVLYVLTGGMVKVAVSAETGVETAIAVRSRGDMIGEFGVLDGMPRAATVRAVGTVGAVRITGPRFFAFTQAHPTALPAIIRSVVAKLRAETARHAAERNWAARERLAQVIYDLATGYGEKADDGAIIIPLPLTQLELGELAGVAVSTTERILAEFRREGLIQTGYREIEVRDMACLGETRFA